jgi:hypothetical protein
MDGYDPTIREAPVPNAYFVRNLKIDVPCDGSRLRVSSAPEGTLTLPASSVMSEKKTPELDNIANGFRLRADREPQRGLCKHLGCEAQCLTEFDPSTSFSSIQFEDARNGMDDTVLEWILAPLPQRPQESATLNVTFWIPNRCLLNDCDRSSRHLNAWSIPSSIIHLLFVNAQIRVVYGQRKVKTFCLFV